MVYKKWKAGVDSFKLIGLRSKEASLGRHLSKEGASEELYIIYKHDSMHRKTAKSLQGWRVFSALEKQHEGGMAGGISEVRVVGDEV